MEVKLEHVCKKIGKAQILDDVTLTLEKGRIYGLRGSNGSGKTMLLRSICGLMKPTGGHIYLDGKELYKEMNFPESVGILIENPAFLNGLTGYENLEVLAAYSGYQAEEITDALTRAGLDPADKRKYRKYSLGMKQKLGIAAAIMGNPDLIILDEPINALDEKSVERVKEELLRLKEEHLILIACHDREELEYLADTIFTVKEGKVYA